MAIVGSGGAGKSVLATELGRRTGLPVIHLDRLFWRPGWDPMPEEAWTSLVRELVAADDWILDGNYSRTLAIRLARADTVILLDLPRLVCLWAVTKRWLRYRGRSRPDMGDGVPEHLDRAFLRWIWNYPSHSRPKVLERLATLPPTVRVERLTSRRAIREFLASIPDRAPAAAPA